MRANSKGREKKGKKHGERTEEEKEVGRKTKMKKKKKKKGKKLKSGACEKRKLKGATERNAYIERNKEGESKSVERRKKAVGGITGSLANWLHRRKTSLYLARTHVSW